MTIPITLPDVMGALADTVPAAVVILVALGFMTWVAGKALDVLDRHLNRKDDDERHP